MSGLAPNAALAQARALRQARRIADSQQLVATALPGPAHATTRWLHDAQWWQPLDCSVCRLVRRSGDDAAFVRRLWSDAHFMQQFHRLAGPLPASDERLREILESEYVALLSDTRSLHWVIQSSAGTPYGVLSLTDISLSHRRAEVLIGVLPGAPFGMATAAMLLLFEFFFHTAGFNKLNSLTYADNPHSYASTKHLGFRDEGVLRQHVFDAATGAFLDMRQMSLLREEAFSASNVRMMRRLGIRTAAVPASSVPAAATAADSR